MNLLYSEIPFVADKGIFAGICVSLNDMFIAHKSAPTIAVMASTILDDGTKRRAGIVRLLSEAFTARKKRAETAKLPDGNPVANTTGYDFLH